MGAKSTCRLETHRLEFRDHPFNKPSNDPHHPSSNILILPFVSTNQIETALPWPGANALRQIDCKIAANLLIAALVLSPGYITSGIEKNLIDDSGCRRSNPHFFCSLSSLLNTRRQRLLR
jgi:hypothetical protein